ncbi:hypothetical protein [Halococcus sp. IIIV-5B]|uniref:DUF7114 family protein n=1 Tax=Halococcus sp. IIIV-5B TaxID=2321230 RepID=UPI000E747DBE|nr:hypothetical protein [Halococcus sp. IIIV-5B]RJT02049.1 hypothetical protein D3261_13695 [Halococcus sp. IIIV-5B]
MDDASHVRRAAREAVRDVDPGAFRDAIETVVESGSMAPGVLVVLSARAADEPVGFGTVATRAAGTQLIYEGLRLTRALAHDAPWEDEDTDANLDVLVADVLVARGFYLLARTEAAERAVETVRAFGRDRTAAAPTDDPVGPLEADVLDLALVAGLTAVDVHPSAACREFVADLAESFDGELPPADDAFDPTTRESLAAHVDTPVQPAGVGSATDP